MTSSSLVLIKTAQKQLFAGDHIGAIKTISDSNTNSSSTDNEASSYHQTCIVSILSQAHFLSGNRDEAYVVALNHAKKLFSPATSHKIVVGSSSSSSKNPLQLLDSQLSSLLFLCQMENLILNSPLSSSANNNNNNLETFSKDIVNFLNMFELNLLSSGIEVEESDPESDSNSNKNSSARKQKVHQLLHLVFNTLLSTSSSSPPSKSKTIIERLPHLCRYANFSLSQKTETEVPSSSSSSPKNTNTNKRSRRITTIVAPEDEEQHQQQLNAITSTAVMQNGSNINNNNLTLSFPSMVLLHIRRIIQNVIATLISWKNSSIRKSALLAAGSTAIAGLIIYLFIIRRGKVANNNSSIRSTQQQARNILMNVGGGGQRQMLQL